MLNYAKFADTFISEKENHKMKLINLIQNTPAWDEFRNGGVGASDIASICGVDGAFQTREKVIQAKLGKKEELSDFTKRMFAEGHEMEPVIREKMEETFGCKYSPAVVTHDQYTRLFASLDGIDVVNERVLEIKTVLSLPKFLQYSKQTPDHYNYQVQWQLYVTGYKTAHIAFFYNGEIVVNKVTADPVLQDYMQCTALDFLKEVDAIKAGTAVAKTQTVNDLTTIAINDLLIKKKQLEIMVESLDEEIKSLSHAMLVKFDATKIESDNISIQYTERKGNIQYKNIPEVKALSEKYLDTFRGKGSISVTTKLKKEKEPQDV